MEDVEGTLPYCNGHRCGGPGDGNTVSEFVSRTSPKIVSEAPSIVQRTTTVSSHGTADRSIRLTRKRKLVLHFDVRNTILVSDSATHDNVEQALNSFLTGVTWGREEHSGWVWYSDRPSLRAPCPGAVTYYKSLERKLVKSPADRVRLRRITGDFTRQPIGQKFRKYFEAHLRLLEWNIAPSWDVASNFNIADSLTTASGHDAPSQTKPELVSADRKLTIVAANGRLYHYLLPSFIKMLYDLQADGRQFSVILRTYGVDAPRVLDSIAHISAGNHPLFPGKLSIDVNGTPGRIRRQPGGRVRCEPPSTADDTDTLSPVVLETDADIYGYLSNVEGVCGFVDDFKFWQERNYAHTDGKPLWINLADRDVQHIFFDDNVRVADAESIVDVRLFDSGSTSSYRSLSLEEIASLENVCLIQADLLECTSNVDYFITKVRQCEVNYLQWFQQHQRSRLHGHEENH